MWKTLYVWWVPICLRRPLNCKSVNALQALGTAAPSTSDKAAGHKSSAVYPFALIFFVVLASSMSSVVAQTISLGDAQNFAVLGGTTVTKHWPVVDHRKSRSKPQHCGHWFSTWNRDWYHSCK
jgi:hypothetical protein